MQNLKTFDLFCVSWFTFRSCSTQGCISINAGAAAIRQFCSKIGRSGSTHFFTRRVLTRARPLRKSRTRAMPGSLDSSAQVTHEGNARELRLHHKTTVFLPLFDSQGRSHHTIMEQDEEDALNAWMHQVHVDSGAADGKKSTGLSIRKTGPLGWCTQQQRQGYERTTTHTRVAKDDRTQPHVHLLVEVKNDNCNLSAKTTRRMSTATSCHPHRRPNARGRHRKITTYVTNKCAQRNRAHHHLKV